MRKFFLTLLLTISGLLFAVNINGQESVPQDSAKNDAQEQKVDKPVKIKRNSYPKFPPMCPDSVGYVALKVTFDKSGKVTDAEVVGSIGCKDFEKSAIDAAKKIKFEPAMKNGEPVTVTKRIQYSFSKGHPNSKKSR